MLVNCPKCGFSQPQDRYCASCGIDMENFKPVGDPFWKKILGNPFVHVGFIFCLVFISILFIRKQQREDLRARVEYLKGGPILVERQEPETTRNAPQNTANRAQPTSAMTTETANGTLPPAPGAGPTPISPSAPASVAANSLGGRMLKPSSSDTQTKSGPMKMLVTYAELDRVTLDAWLDEMRAAGQLRQFGAVSMGTLNQAAVKMKSARNLKVLQKINRNFEPANPTLEWFVGTHHGSDPENETGLFSSLTMNSDNKEGLIRGELEVQRAFRDPKDVTKTIERVSFGGPFELMPGGAYLMTGLIPRNYATELEDEMNPDAFLSIFKSRPFLNRETEFTLIMEFDTAAK